MEKRQEVGEKEEEEERGMKARMKRKENEWRTRRSGESKESLGTSQVNFKRWVHRHKRGGEAHKHTYKRPYHSSNSTL